MKIYLPKSLEAGINFRINERGKIIDKILEEEPVNIIYCEPAKKYVGIDYQQRVVEILVI